MQAVIDSDPRVVIDSDVMVSAAVTRRDSGSEVDSARVGSDMVSIVVILKIYDDYVL